jgi:PKD repeat protein
MMKSPYAWYTQKKTCLIMFFLMVTFFICFPAVTGEQIKSNVHISLQNQTPSVKLLAGESQQPSLLKATDSSTAADYIFNVGTHITIMGWEVSSDPPPSGVTIVFQRSEDGGATWCTYYTGVTGADGYAYVDRTETCPGIVYYRAADIHGLGSANSFSIQWLQTNPPTICVPIPRCVDKSYAMTMIQKPGQVLGGVGELAPWGTMVHDVVQNKLESDNWQNVFYHTEEGVTPADFGVFDSYPNVNNATLFYHMGHGHEDWLMQTHHSYIPLSGWPLSANSWIDHRNVYKKWGDKNKWVILDSCSVLIDKQWGAALGTSHGILGYSSIKNTSTDLPTIFFENAITGNKPITESYYIATKEAACGSRPTVIFDDPYQLYWDHLPGHGNIVSDENPDDNIVYYAEWDAGVGGYNSLQGSSLQSTVLQSAIGEVTLNTTLPSSPPEIPIFAATVNPGDIIRNWSDDLMDEQHNVTPEADAPQVALNVLQTEGGGLPQGAILSRVNTTYLYGYYTDTGEIVNRIPLLTSVQYHREINGMPIGGRGGLIDISLGEDGKNLGLLKVWRTPSDAGVQKIMPADAAVEKLKNGELLEIPQVGINVTINNIKLGYFEKGATEQQAFFEPIWIFYGELDSGESIDLYVYARKFANFTAIPLIVSTGDPMTFTDTSETHTIKWYWDFGDGTNSPLKNPTHAYQTGGNYTVNLTAWNDLGSDTISKTEYITIYPDPKPGASFTTNYSWDNRTPPVMVSFNDTSVGFLTNWSWDFGDGTNSTEQSPTHVFNLIPGDVDDFYGVTLTVTDHYGRTSTIYDSVYVQMDYHPNFTAEPTRGLAPLNVTFTDTSPPLNNIDALWWDFGDGTYFEWYNDGTGATLPHLVYHEYTKDGNYSVTLSIMPNYHTERSYQSTKDDLIYVGNIYPPEANFTANITSGNVPLSVSFTDTSAGAPTRWSWSFGDSGTSTEQNPEHLYTAAGNYTISLMVTNEDGSDMKTRLDYITVTSQGLPVPEFPFIGHSVMSVGQPVSAACLPEHQ